jgi:hypothetical protein
VELFNDSSPTTCSTYANPVASQTISIGSANAGRKTTGIFNLATTYPKLRCRVTDANGASTVYGCSSDDFSVRPVSPIVTTTASAAAPSATAAPVVNSGAAFTIGATTSGSDSYTGTLALDSSKLSAQLPSNATTAQSGGTVGTLTVDPAVQANASPAQSNNATWNEVGYLYAAAGAFRDDSFTSIDQAAGDCISATANNAYLADTFDANNKIGCSIGNKTAVAFGRFVPNHFSAVGTLANTCTAGTFTYMGQSFSLSTANVVEARNVTNGVTQNYANFYAPGTVSFGAENADNGTNLLSRLTFSPSGSWISGIYTLADASGTFARPTTTVADATWGAFDSLDIGLTVNDSDVTTSPKVSGADMNPTTAGGTSFAYKKLSASPLRMRFGRLALQNAYGSELLDLPMSLTAEYWNGTGWVKNTDDKCTTGISLSLTDPITDDGLIPGELCAWDTGTPGSSGLGCSVAGANDYKFNEPPLATAGGNYNLNFRAPGTGNTGALDITATVPDYLRFNWKGTGDINPTARATFGIYKGNSHFIYFREAY